MKSWNKSSTEVLNLKFMKKNKLPILKKLSLFQQLMVEHYVYCWCIDIRISHLVEGIKLRTKYLEIGIKWPIEMLVFCLTKSIKPKTTNCNFLFSFVMKDLKSFKLPEKITISTIKDSVLFIFRRIFGCNSRRIRGWASGDIIATSIHKVNYGLTFLLKWPVCKKPEWKKMVKNTYLIWKLYTIDHPNKFSWKSLSNNFW